MSYCPIDKEIKDHLLNLIKFLHEEVLSAGGDGDALWYSRYFKVEEIVKLIEEFNSNQRFPWEIKIDEKRIQWGTGQEGVTITNDEADFTGRPPWTQCAIIL